MNRVELEGVLAHELSHIRNYDILVMTLAVTMVGIIALLSDFFLRFMFWAAVAAAATTTTATTRSAIVFVIFGFVLLIFAPIIAYVMQFAVSRRREYLADASGVQLTRYPPGLISALEKLKDDTHVDPLRVEGDRASLDRGAARQGDEQGQTPKLEPPVRHASAARRPDPTPCRRCESAILKLWRTRRVQVIIGAVVIVASRGRASSSRCGARRRRREEGGGQDEPTTTTTAAKPKRRPVAPLTGLPDTTRRVVQAAARSR